MEEAERDIERERETGRRSFSKEDIEMINGRLRKAIPNGFFLFQ